MAYSKKWMPYDFSIWVAYGQTYGVKLAQRARESGLQKPSLYFE